MRPNRSRHPLLIAILGIVLLSLACARQNPIAPSNTAAVVGSSPRLAATPPAPSRADFYPLTIGNHWHYDRTFLLRYAPGADPGDTIRSEVDRDLIGKEVLFGREYVLEQETIVQDSRPGEIFRYWTRFRQDREGLYYADLFASEPPQTDDVSTPMAVSSPVPATPNLNASVPSTQQRLAVYEMAERRLSILRQAALGARRWATGGPGGAASNEVTLLQYPLRPGASWALREDPRVVYTVEALETLDLPIGRRLGYRIRVDFGSEPDPNSTTHVWYGRAGMLGYRIWLLQIGGYPSGYFEAEEEEWLEEATLIGPGRERAD
jgi:hypothetical protein